MNWAKYREELADFIIYNYLSKNNPIWREFHLTYNEEQKEKKHDN